MILFTTNKFKKAVKCFRKTHNARVLDDLWTAINKIYNQEVGSSMSNHKLKGKYTNGFKDMHLAGGDFILLYRYDVDDDTLVISAKLRDIIDHKELHEKGVFSEPEWIKTTLEELDKQINGSVQLGDDLDEDDILDWFYNYYNTKIARILAIDEIRPVSIIDRGDSLFIRAKGIQYYSLHSKQNFRQCRRHIIDQCLEDDVVVNLFTSDFGDEDEYSIVLTIVVPLEEVIE